MSRFATVTHPTPPVQTALSRATPCGALRRPPVEAGGGSDRAKMPLVFPIRPMTLAYVVTGGNTRRSRRCSSSSSSTRTNIGWPGTHIIVTRKRSGMSVRLLASK
jgi:hypothetical protein